MNFKIFSKSTRTKNTQLDLLTFFLFVYFLLIVNISFCITESLHQRIDLIQIDNIDFFCLSMSKED